MAADNFTLIVKGGTVVNHDGIGVRDIDLTVVDLKRRETIGNGWIASRCGWNPYDGASVQGWPVGTIVRGRRVMWEGKFVGASQGEPVRFH